MLLDLHSVFLLKLRFIRVQFELPTHLTFLFEILLLHLLNGQWQVPPQEIFRCHINAPAVIYFPVSNSIHPP